MKVLRYLLLCFVLLAVCGGASAKQKYNYDGVRFSYPEEWRIVEDGRSEFVNIRLETKNDNSGTVGFMWSDTDLGTMISADEFFDSILGVVPADRANVQMEAITDARFGKYPAEGRRFAEGTAEKRISGEMYIVRHKGRWMFILRVYADGDSGEHTEGFKMMERSLRIAGKSKK